MKGLIITAAVITLIAALPMESGPENEDLHNDHASPNSTIICEEQTPCAWSVLQSNTEFVDINITNSYCTCGPGRTCQVSERDSAASALVYKCS